MKINLCIPTTPWCSTIIYGGLLAIFNICYRGLSALTVFYVCHDQFINLCVNIIHNTIMFYRDIWRASSHIPHLLRRASAGLNILSRSIIRFLSRRGVLPKQLIVSIMTKYLISWLSRKTHLKFKAKQQKTNKIN